MFRLSLLPLLLSAVSYGASFDITSYTLLSSIGGSNFSSLDAPLAIDYTLVGALDVPTLHVAGTLGFYDGDTPFQFTGTPAGTLSLRFTDAIVECTGGTGACNPFAIQFSALFTAAYAGPRGNFTQAPRSINVDTFLGIDGTGNNNKGILGVLLSNVTYLSPTVGGYFADMVSVGLDTIHFPGNNSVQFTLTGNAMATGTSISMPGSVWYSFEQAVPTDVPEPGTVLLVTGALAGAWWLRRQSK